MYALPKTVRFKRIELITLNSNYYHIKSIFSLAKIAGILKKFSGGWSAEELTKGNGIGIATLYKWRQRYTVWNCFFFEVGI